MRASGKIDWWTLGVDSKNYLSLVFELIVDECYKGVPTTGYYNWNPSSGRF
jgi:hypothetical protein